MGIITHMKRCEPLQGHIITHMKRYEPLERHMTIALVFLFQRFYNREATPHNELVLTPTPLRLTMRPHRKTNVYGRSNLWPLKGGRE